MTEVSKQGDDSSSHMLDKSSFSRDSRSKGSISGGGFLSVQPTVGLDNGWTMAGQWLDSRGGLHDRQCTLRWVGDMLDGRWGGD